MMMHMQILPPNLKVALVSSKSFLAWSAFFNKPKKHISPTFAMRSTKNHTRSSCVVFVLNELWRQDAAATLGNNLPEHVRQDAAGAVVVDLDGGIEADDYGDVEAFAAGGFHR